MSRSTTDTLNGTTLAQSVDLVVAAVRGTDPARDDDPTPCTDYTVAQLVDHIAWGLTLARLAGAREPWPQDWKFGDPAPVLAGVPREGWADAVAAEAAAVVEAWLASRAWEGESHMGGSPMPASAIGAMMVAEFALHAWDLETATGRAIDVPHGEAVLEAVSGIAAMGREGGWFGPEVPVDAAVPAFDRALGLSGRDPARAAH